MCSRTCSSARATAGRAAILGLLLWCFSSDSSWSSGSSAFDGPIAAAVDEWWPDLPFWKLWKSQLIAESNLDPRAHSSVGADGIAQVMPATFRDLALVLKFPANVTAYDAAYAIRAGAYYDGKLRRTWHSGRTPIEAHPLALASYNAGTGWIVRAQAACLDARLWPEISPCLAAVTGTANAKQTTDYVARTLRVWKELESSR